MPPPPWCCARRLLAAAACAAAPLSYPVLSTRQTRDTQHDGQFRQKCVHTGDRVPGDRNHFKSLFTQGDPAPSRA